MLKKYIRRDVTGEIRRNIEAKTVEVGTAPGILTKVSSRCVIEDEEDFVEMKLPSLTQKESVSDVNIGDNLTSEQS